MFGRWVSSGHRRPQTRSTILAETRKYRRVRMGHEEIWWKCFPGSRRTKCREPEAGECLMFLRNSKETLLVL